MICTYTETIIVHLQFIPSPKQESPISLLIVGALTPSLLLYIYIYIYLAWSFFAALFDPVVVFRASCSKFRAFAKDKKKKKKG